MIEDEYLSKTEGEESTRSQSNLPEDIKEDQNVDRDVFRDTDQVIESFVDPEADGFALDFI
jgi:hypothetical protein